MRKRIPLILIATGWLVASVTAVVMSPTHADEPPDTTVTPAGEVFTDAPWWQGVTLSADSSCQFMTVYFDSTATHTLDGLTLEVSVDDSGSWTTLDTGQSAKRFDGWHSVIEGRITVNGKQVDSERLINTTTCDYSTLDTPPPPTT